MGKTRSQHAAIGDHIDGTCGRAGAPRRTRMTRSFAIYASVQWGGSWGWPHWLLVAALVLCVAALISIWADRYHSTASRVVWTFVVALLPIVGPIAWFVLGWERR